MIPGEGGGEEEVKIHKRNLQNTIERIVKNFNNFFPLPPLFRQELSTNWFPGIKSSPTRRSFNISTDRSRVPEGLSLTFITHHAAQQPFSGRGSSIEAR